MFHMFEYEDVMTSDNLDKLSENYEEYEEKISKLKEHIKDKKMNPTQDEEAVNDILYLTEIIEKLEKELIEQNAIVKYLQRELEINYFQRKTHI
jgi:predicted RNase H-like nuclease (RuvC/YqgF family)